MTTQHLEGGTDAGVFPRRPVIVGALVCAAFVSIAVSWTSSRAFAPFSSFHPGPVIHGLLLASPFAIAAAALVGARRWRSGRSWLAAGAAAFAIVGLLGLVVEIAFALAAGDFETFAEPAVQSVFAGRLLLVGVLGIVAPVLLGVGLRRGATAVSPLVARKTAMVLLGMLAIAAASSTILVWATVQVSPSTVPDELWAVHYILLAGGAIATAWLGIVAIGVMPRHGGTPERLIAAGTALILAAAAWTHWGTLAAPRNVELPAAFYDWFITAPNALQLAGTVVLVIGFAAGARLRTVN